MEVNVKLYKKEGTYFSKSKNKDVPYINFYLSINGNNIPVEVKYFPNEKFDGRDPGYSGRVAVMSTFAVPYPESENSDSSLSEAPVASEK